MSGVFLVSALTVKVDHKITSVLSTWHFQYVTGGTFQVRVINSSNSNPTQDRDHGNERRKIHPLFPRDCEMSLSVYIGHNARSTKQPGLEICTLCVRACFSMTCDEELIRLRSDCLLLS